MRRAAFLRLPLPAIASLLLAACAPTWQNLQQQTPIDGPGRAYVALMTAGWKQAPTDGDVLLLTRDGVFLQQISITRHALDEAFADHPVTADTAPQELAVLQLKRLQQVEPELVRRTSKEEEGLLALFPIGQARPLPGTTERVAMRATQVDGHEAFRLDTRSRNGWGLNYFSETIGFVHEGDYWVVRYLAPELYYAHRDQATFDAFVKNLKLKRKCRLFCSK
jgi:hypothetical protein